MKRVHRVNEIDRKLKRHCADFQQPFMRADISVEMKVQCSLVLVEYKCNPVNVLAHHISYCNDFFMCLIA